MSRPATTTITLPHQDKSNGQLFALGRELWAEVERLMARRRGRDRACHKLTDLFQVVECLSRRLAEERFDEPAVVRLEDEEEDRGEMLRGERGQLAMADLFTPMAEDDEAEAATAEGVSINELRLRYFRQFLDFMTVGCSTPDQVLVKVLAIIRRVRPESMADLGLSQAEVGRAMGASRQTVHAREKKVETLLQKHGARGFQGLGGQRSATHREKCRVAQLGNSNRKKRAG